MALYEIIKAVQTTSGSNAKKAILEANKDYPMLSSYLKAVYDPKINYWMKKLPTPDKVGEASLWPDDIDRVIQVIGGREYTGKAAAEYVKGYLELLNEQGQELLKMLLLKDIRAGIAEGGILDVFPGLFYIPPYQRCASMSAENKERFGQKPYFYVQTKSDGQFAYAGRDGAQTFLMSRAGSLHPQWLADEICSRVPLGYVAMGELLVYKGNVLLSRKDGNGILNSLLSGDGSKFDPETMVVRFYAWDLVMMTEFTAGESERPYDSRWGQVVYETDLLTVACWKVNSVREANRIQAEHTARGEEGTVWKNPEMGWRDCSSGDKDMMKAKTVFEADYRIRGYYEGKGKAKGKLGGLELETEDGLIQFNVGSGFSDDQRLALWHIRDTLPGKIVAAEGNDIVTDKKRAGIEAVFLPIFIEVRQDKFEADSSTRVWEQFLAARMGGSS